MIRDPHYKAILEGLAAGPDPEAFERCAQALLREIYPTLTPVEGGRDFGMDGLDASDPEQPKILAATTGQDVKRNLVESLRSHKRQSANIRARHVVVATTQVATATLIDDLRGAAADEGFQLVNVHGQREFADLLYRKSHWTRELLGLSGAPAALSAVPASSRPMNSLPLVGRDADRQWLANSSGDIVGLGASGLGQDALTSPIVDQGWLFMVDPDRGRVANAVRDLQPDAIIVDDAHADLNSLGSLQQLRAAIGAEFRIVAVTWPGDIDGVASTLAVSPDSVLDLGSLSRDEILEIVKAAGIAGPVELQRAIVNQSGGRPGLTATLCDVAWRGDLRPLLSGELLLREIGMVPTRVGDSDGMQVLAVMALAGDRGASLDDVANVLGLDMAKSKRSLALLGHSGVFRATFLADKVTVWPLELRFAAVGDAFFSDQAYQNLPFELAMRHLDESGVAGALVGAALMGAQVPSTTIQPILRRSGAVDDFKGYARIGKRQAAFALNTRPEWLAGIAPHSLLTSPVETLQMLLERAVGNRRPQNSQTDHPLRIAKDWVESAPHSKGEQLKRRRILADVAVRYAENSGDPQVGLEALCRAMSPKFESINMDAGSGMSGTMQFGLVSHECLNGLIGLWPAILNAVPTKGPEDYSVLIEMLANWAYFGSRPESPPDDIQELMQSHAVGMAADLTKKFSDHPGILASISEFARRAELGVDVSVPSVFEILYPQKDHSVFASDGMKGMERQDREWRAKARKLARDCEPQGPERVLAVVLEANRQAAEVKKNWPDMTDEFAAELAHWVAEPYTWADQAIDGGLSADFVEPLLRAVRAMDRERAPPIVIHALKSERAQGAGVSVVLSATDPAECELKETMGIASEFQGLIGNLVLRREIPTSTIRSLLKHPSPDVAETTAANLWSLDRQPRVPEDLFSDWRAAILRASARNWITPIVFENEPCLFAEWLLAYLRSDAVREAYRIERDIEKAFDNLSTEQRIKALSVIPESNAFSAAWIVSRLVGDNIAVFRLLLTRDSLARVNEAGFACSVSEEKVKSACEAGWESGRIASAIMSPIGIGSSWIGNESNYWAGRREEFAGYARSDDAHIAAVGRAIHEYAQREIDDAMRRERDRDVYGH